MFELWYFRNRWYRHHQRGPLKAEAASETVTKSKHSSYQPAGTLRIGTRIKINHWMLGENHRITIEHISFDRMYDKWMIRMMTKAMRDSLLSSSLSIITMQYWSFSIFLLSMERQYLWLAFHTKKPQKRIMRLSYWFNRK